MALVQDKWDALVPAEKVYHQAKALKAAFNLKNKVDKLINHLAQDMSMVIGSEAAYLLVAAEISAATAQQQAPQRLSDPPPSLSKFVYQHMDWQPMAIYVLYHIPNAASHNLVTVKGFCIQACGKYLLANNLRSRLVFYMWQQGLEQ
ncbi:hypothetical protein CBOM_02648 [Ceraceosorus bombacis]|uniref:Uncharacterized protein n=1 Tax=Ceraceosorus bombacis TaxID=401625 RepID=A0A0P1BFJ7_9BASI|nr:hypothetical protein CBOM_02648 [Ceraceosorus bombacis]